MQFRLGRVRDGVRGPGVVFVIPLVDRVRQVSADRHATDRVQGIITRDNVSVGVSAVAYYRVEDSVRSIVAIENVSAAISQIAQTTLRAVVGRHTLDETLSETEEINKTSAKSSTSRPRNGASRSRSSASRTSSHFLSRERAAGVSDMPVMADASVPAVGDADQPADGRRVDTEAFTGSGRSD